MSSTTTLPSKTSTSSPRPLSASCQQIVEEDFSQPTHARVVIHSSFSEPSLWPSVAQHLCNGVALVSSVHYGDMATIVATYIWKAYRGHGTEALGLNMCRLEVDHTYQIKVPPRLEGQWIEMEAIMTVPESSSGDIIDAEVRCHFRSIKPDGTKIQDLARCSVLYEWLPGWLSSWSNHADLIKTKINNLHSRARAEGSGEVQHMHRQRAYELFKSFVDYGPKYQNMASVIIDTKTLEATSRLELQPDPQNDYTGPFYIDASGHISGFVCNTADEDINKNAYISHGCDAMKLSPKFAPYKGADIQNYTQMQPLASDPTVMSGDVYMLQDGEVVGLWEGVKFKRIPRRVLNVFLPPPKKT